MFTLTGYRVLWTGMGAQLARDVPFSGICWSTLEPVSFHLLELEAPMVIYFLPSTSNIAFREKNLSFSINIVKTPTTELFGFCIYLCSLGEDFCAW